MSVNVVFMVFVMSPMAVVLVYLPALLAFYVTNTAQMVSMVFSVKRDVVVPPMPNAILVRMCVY